MDTLEAYNSIAETEKLPKMKRGGLDINTDSLQDPDEIWRRIGELNPTQGWLLFQSHQTVFHDGLPAPHDVWGMLLACEAIDAEGVSLALEQDGTGGWRLTRYRHEAEGDMLIDEPTFLAHDPKSGSLCYRRYWRQDTEQGYVQAVACFIGFE